MTTALSIRQHARSGAARAFTLIELLVVISVIAMLLALLIPALSSARNSAKNALCGARHKQLATALFNYTNDSRDYMPSNDVDANTVWKITFTPTYNGSVTIPEHLTGLGLLNPYTNGAAGAEIYFCANENAYAEGASHYGLAAQTYGVAALRRRFNGISGSNTVITDIWYRCGWNAQKYVSQRLSYLTAPYDGIFMCAGTISAVGRLKWSEIHQGDGFNWTAADGHVEWYSNINNPVPPDWGSNGDDRYDITYPRSTLNKASKLIRGITTTGTNPVMP